jgi:very-short-patch-repair endonuclease
MINFLIDKIKDVHGNKYDYSLVEYINMKTKVKIICPEHGIFKQSLKMHIHRKQGCPFCIGKYKTTKSYIIEAINIHKNKYDYSLVEYINGKSKIKIICPEHGIFEQEAISHLSGNGCPDCGGSKKLTTKIFIERAISKHGNKYDYSLVEYINMKTKVKIICPDHGIFEQLPQKHLIGQSCKLCKSIMSKGEKSIFSILESKNIIFEQQKTFNDCIYKRKLPFDFYLLDFNLCIEFDGEQHFKAYDYFGGKNKLKIQQKRDSIKNIYCKNNNINLLRIKFNENIEEKLLNHLNEKNI